MSNVTEIVRQIDRHIHTIQTTSSRSTVLWHSSRCGGKIKLLSYAMNSDMGYAETDLVRDACREERNRLFTALVDALDRTNSAR